MAPSRRDCSAEVARFNAERREARGLAKRTFYSQMLNLTCVLSPENSIPSTYVANPPIRSALNVNNAPGVELIVDIGVMDTTTCKPLSNAMVELWGPNAVGQYSTTALRGAIATASNGIAEFQTIFPGFTAGAANHLNILVHQTGSESSSVAHVGQLFFYDSWNEFIGAYTNYNQNTNPRMLNANDPNFVAASKNGVNPIIDTESINDDWPEGALSHATAFGRR
ncbi:aromatic compound dioxygenase [Mycena amicta]|nr:aromatic compound dioxygenase [Mycena amicta]